MPRRILEGDVVSDKQDKTVTVLVERRYRDPMYKKYVKKTSKYAAHDEANHFKAGDRVQIIECAPISKRKRWTVLIDGAEPAPAPKKPAAPKKEAKKEDKKAEAKEEKAEAPKKETKKKAPAKKAAAKKQSTSAKATADKAKKKDD